MTPSDAEILTNVVAAWVQGHPDLKALGVAGSWARGTARPDSDIDFIILADDQSPYKDDQSWLGSLPLPEQYRLLSHRSMDYSAVWSCHTFLEPDAELELTFCRLDWASVEPVDPGTREVVSDGFKVIVDKEQRLQRLVDTIAKMS